ncbi:MAG: GAF domain-containing protein [Candidatus Neomarinimicrobiota bacterium]
MTTDRKKQLYRQLLEKTKALLGPDGYQMDSMGRMATITAILKIHFPEWIFIGFYRRIEDKILEIGPYQGAVIACGIIRFGQGVCGEAADKKKTINVPDVSKHENYISCSPETRSEIVIPVLKDNNVVSMLDVDSPVLSGFDSIDEKYLEEITSYL